MALSTDIKSGASISNSAKNSTATLFRGEWEDIKDYASLIITIQSPIDGSGTLKWANTTRRQFPSDGDVIAEEHFNYYASDVKTLQWDHRGRWFKLEYTDGADTAAVYNDLSLNIETLYKGVPTELKISDDSQHVTSLHHGDTESAYQVVYTDRSGVPLATTDDGTTEGEALFVHLRDASSNIGYANTTTGTKPEALFTALRDNNNENLTTTVLGNTLHVHPSNQFGYSQASTYDVSGAHTGDRGLFLTGADNTGNTISTTKTSRGVNDKGHNALLVHLTLSGAPISQTNPLPCIESGKIAQTLYFDISSGITSDRFYTVPDLSSGRINLFNMFTYNDGATTVWTKLYDMSVGHIEHPLIFANYNDRVMLNIATPAGQTRDLKFPRGMLFSEGLYFRSATEPNYDSIADPGEDVLFVNGAYFKTSAEDKEPVNFGHRGDDDFTDAKVADLPSFPSFPEPEDPEDPVPEPRTIPDEPEPEPEPRTIPEEPEPEPEHYTTDKTIAFRADGENHIEGSVTFMFNTEEELLSLITLVNTSAHPLKELSFSYDDDMGNQVQYDIDIGALQLGVPLTTENINVNTEQLQTSKVLLTLNNDMIVNIAYNGV